MKKLERPPIWIVMSLNQNREAFIHAICTDEERAELYKEGIRRDPMLKSPLDIWIEKSEANHLWMWNLAQESRPINARDYLPMQEQIAQLKAKNESQAETIKDCHRKIAALSTKLADALKKGE